MLKYKCNKCKRVFETCLTAVRCSTLSCHSRNIKDVSVSHRGVKYRDFEGFKLYNKSLLRDYKEGRDTSCLHKNKIEPENTSDLEEN